MKFVQLMQIKYDAHTEVWRDAAAIWVNMEHVHHMSQQSPGTWMAFSPVYHPSSGGLWDAGYRVKEDVSEILAKV